MIQTFLRNLIHFEACEWQYPAITEKQAYLNHLACNRDASGVDLVNIYVAVPWANHIDDPEVTEGRLKKLRSRFADFKKKLDKVKSQAEKSGKKVTLHTVCQHVRWYRLIDFWDFLGIDKIWLSHMTCELDPEIFQPWPLYAVNIEDPSRGQGLETIKTQDKRYLCSFIGAHTEAYRSEIRVQLDQIFKKRHHADIYFELTDEWFFQSLVYENQVKGNPVALKGSHFDRVLKYNQTLSQSVFSLCPEGSGPSSIRLWESLAMGVIPVLFENDWFAPQLPKMPWTEFSITIKTKDLPETVEILRSYTTEQIEKMRLNCFEAYKQFRIKTCF